MKFHSTILLHFAAFYLIVNKVNALRLPDAGVCPNLPPPSYCTDNYDFCKTDEDCGIADYKCCWNGCKNICAAAVLKATIHKNNTTIDRQRPGNCPVLPIRKFCIDHDMHECSDDYDCKEYYKCCSNGCTRHCVVSTAKKAIGSGSTVTNATCPVFPTSSSNCPVGIPNKCTADIDCRDQGDSFKCCWDGCRKLCLNPSEIRQTDGRGSCPGMLRPSVCGNVEHECLNDKECIRGQKCCSDGCSLKCVDAKDTKKPTKNDTTVEVKIRLDDECPFVTRPAKCPSSSLHQCYRNEECPDPLTCCSDGCRNICQDLDQDTTRILCPILRRPDVCLNINNTCTNIEDCNIDQTCCSDGCRFRCFGQAGFESENNGQTSTTAAPLTTAKAHEPTTGASLPNVAEKTTSEALDTTTAAPPTTEEDVPTTIDEVVPVTNAPKTTTRAVPASTAEQLKKSTVVPTTVEKTRATSPTGDHILYSGGANGLFRPGKCPKMTKPGVCGSKPNIECNYDVDCRKSPTQKCCTDGCNRQCVEAIGLKPVIPVIPVNPVDPPTDFAYRPGNILGRCPPYSPTRNCPALVQDDCTCSSDCGFGNKCCFDGCKRVCTTPKGNECSTQVDIVYLMDTSGSISLSDYRREKQFVKDLARIFRVGKDASQAAVTIYNDDPHERITLGELTSPDDFEKAIDDIPYLHGRTRIDKALNSSFYTFQKARPNKRKILVLLTDGRQTQDPDTVPLDQASQPLKDMGVKIYAIGVGHEIDRAELDVITGSPEAVFTVDSFTALLGESQTIAEKACGDIIDKICIRGVDLGFIIDASESITDDDFVKEQNAVKAITDEFLVSPVRTRVGVVVYSAEPKLSIEFDQYSSNAEFNSAVNNLPHMQSHTRLDKALEYAASNLYNRRRPANPAIAIVMTDGKQTPGAKSLTLAVQPLRDLGVRVFAVGVGPRVSKKELREIVQRPDDVFEVDSFSQLIKEAKKITERACPAPSETKLPTIVPPTTTPQPSTSSTTTLATSPPISIKPNPCSHFLDIIFVLDSSRSMDVRQYVKQKEFVKRLAKIFNVGKGSRAAAIIYSDDPLLEINFNTFRTQEGFLAGVDNLPYIMQRTRIDKALIMASQVVKETRPGFPKAVIIMTDGRQTRDPGYTKLDVAAAPLHEAGAKVLVVGIGPAISVEELKKMVKNKTSDIFTVKSFDGLVNATSSVAIKSCEGTAPTVVQRPCSQIFDIAFVMDSSGSMKISNYNKQKSFVKSIVGRFSVGENQVKVGLLSFSDGPSTHVAFNSSSSVFIKEFNAAVDRAEFIEGRTRIDKALEEASNMFKNGRPNVPKLLVFLTDGQQSPDPGYVPIDDAVRPLNDQNVHIMVVGVGQDIDTSHRELLSLANNREKDVIKVRSFDDLDKVKNSFVQTICRKIEEIVQAGAF